MRSWITTHRVLGASRMRFVKRMSEFRWRHPPRVRPVMRTPLTGDAKRIFWSRSRQTRLIAAAMYRLQEAMTSAEIIEDGHLVKKFPVLVNRGVA